MTNMIQLLLLATFASAKSLSGNYIIGPPTMTDENKVICSTWSVDSVDNKYHIKSNANDHILNVNMAYGLSSLNVKPVKKITIQLLDDDDVDMYKFTMDEFINMMNYDGNDFIYAPVVWQFDNCKLRSSYIDSLKEQIRSSQLPQKADTVGVKYIDATSCLDNLKCIHDLCPNAFYDISTMRCIYNVKKDGDLDVYATSLMANV